jgi:hypothetical protein
MINIEIFDGQWKLEDLSDDKVYIFNDNNAKIGKYGLSVIRGLSNSLGIRVKKGPSKNAVAFYSDDDYDENITHISEDILLIKKMALEENKVVVFSNLGYGNNIDKMYQTAPMTYEFLNNQLKYHFGFDNISGKPWNIIPSHSDILKADVISLDKSELVKSVIVNPVGVSSHLYNESITDLIKSGKKTAFTQNKSYNIGELIVFSLENERLLCQVCCSYPLSLISNKSWCLFESFTDEFLKKNIDIYDMGYIQTHFKFLFSIEDNKINLENNYYKEEEPVEVKVEETNLVVVKEEVINKEDNLSKEELLKHIQDLKNQIEELKKPFFIKKIESIKIWFNKKFGRKSVYQLLDSNNLKGDLFKVDNIFGKGIYYRLVNDKWTHYIDFKIGRFKNSINILITFKND